MAHLLLHRQLEAQASRERRTARVLGLMRAAGAREARQTAAVRASARRGNARLAHR